MAVAPLADVHARIAAIQARFPLPGSPLPPIGLGAGGAPGLASGVPAPVVLPGTFADALEQAQRPATPPGAPPGTVPGAPPGAADPGAGPGVEAVLQSAHRYLCVPYLWGGTDPSAGLDCSGFVQLVFRQHGVDLPRVSRDQARAGVAVPSLEQARPGDLVAFGSPVDHIGIYLGDGKMIVAPHTGAHVRVQEITRPITAIRRVLPG